jgi:hypothetical protein
MVIEDPTSDEEKEAIIKAIKETDVVRGELDIKNTNTAGDAYDYILSFREKRTRKFRHMEAKVKWHDSEEDWEVNFTSIGSLLS